LAQAKPVVAVGLGLSLEHFFTDTPVPPRKKVRLSGLRGEVLSFQVVFRSPKRNVPIELETSGPLAGDVSQRRIDLAHVEHPTYATPLVERIGHAPGFYPDPLVPEPLYRTYPDQTRGVWLTLPIPPDAKAGLTRLDILVKAAGVAVGRLRVDVEVIGATLPEQTLKNIHWFHNDCLMSWYKMEAWSREHWQMVQKYLRNAAEHGINTITTPVFTPPLDTAIGTERPTVQLVDVEVVGKDEYRFDMRRLEKWIDVTRACGMTDFEISHLSTQWGAKFAPKVIATVNGKAKRIFGWDTPSTGPRYRAFLQQFLPKLVGCLRKKNAVGRAYLHVSDEPHIEHLPQYGAVREILRRGAPELPVVEALSNIEFFEHGFVDRPCPATNHVQPFLDRKVDHLWCYYCCGQTDGVSNRFMDFPSARNRILGWQLYKFGFEGFLQWGYNHWYEGLTSNLIDPYTNSHAGRPLPPGDGFVVYPGKDGPVDALRWEVFREGLQDMRALQLLETLAAERPSKRASQLLGLRAVKSLKEYPRSMNWLLGQREAVNGEIKKRVEAGR
jgi:hypothetical protein